MKRLGFSAALACCVLGAAVAIFWPVAWAQLGGGGLKSTVATQSSMHGSGAVSSCTGDAVSFDSNGVAGCQHTTDVAPQGTMLRSQAAFPGGTQTASKLVLCGGQDETLYTIVSYAACGTDSMTVTVVDSNGASTATALVEATDWTAATSNAVTATNLADAIDALAGVSAVASSAVVQVSLDPGTCLVTTATSDVACATRTEGTPGVIEARRSVGSLVAAASVGFGVQPGAYFSLDTTNGDATFYEHTGTGRIRFSKDLDADSLYSSTSSLYGNNNSRLQIVSAKTDGATAVAVSTSSNVAFSTAGATLLSIRNNDVEQAAFDKDGAIRLNTAGGAGQPACAAGIRGTVWYTAGGAGVLDKLEVCRKDAADAYAWVSLF